MIPQISEKTRLQIEQMTLQRQAEHEAVFCRILEAVRRLADDPSDSLVSELIQVILGCPIWEFDDHIEYLPYCSADGTWRGAMEALQLKFLEFRHDHSDPVICPYCGKDRPGWEEMVDCCERAFEEWKDEVRPRIIRDLEQHGYTVTRAESGSCG